MPALDEAILKVAIDLPGIAVLVVFGSRASGDHRPDSDSTLPSCRTPPIPGFAVISRRTSRQRSRI
jgi:hypothetical protein